MTGEMTTDYDEQTSITTTRIDMEDQLPIVMLVLLGTVGLFLYPTKMLSDRINKGPAYGSGLALASLAIGATFPFASGAHAMDLCHRRRGRHRPGSAVGLDREHGP